MHECDDAIESYLLVLVSGDSSEDRLREAEGLDSLPAGNRLVGRQFAAEVLPDDMNARLVLVHGVEDDLKKWRERKEDEMQPIVVEFLLKNSKKLHHTAYILQ